MRSELLIGLALLLAATGCGPRPPQPPPRRRAEAPRVRPRQQPVELAKLRAQLDRWRDALSKASKSNRVSLKALVKGLPLAPGATQRCGGSSTKFVAVRGPAWQDGAQHWPALLVLPFGDEDPGDTADCLVSFVRSAGRLRLAAGVVKLGLTDSRATALERARWTDRGGCQVLGLTWRAPPAAGSDPAKSGAKSKHREVSFFSVRGHLVATLGRYVLKRSHALEKTAVYRNIESKIAWPTVAGRPHLVVTTRREDTDPAAGSTTKRNTLVVKRVLASCAVTAVENKALIQLRNQPGGQAIPAPPRPKQ